MQRDAQGTATAYPMIKREADAIREDVRSKKDEYSQISHHTGAMIFIDRCHTMALTK